MGSLGASKSVAGRECQLQKVARREPKEGITIDPIGVRVSPRNGVTFEADNSHIRRNATSHPAPKLRRFRVDSGARWEVEVAGNWERGLICVYGSIFVDPTRSGGAQSREELCVEKVKGLMQRETEKSLSESSLHGVDVRERNA